MMRSGMMLPVVALGSLVVIAGCGTKAVTPLPQEQILTGQRVSAADGDVVTQAYRIAQLDNREGQLAATQSSDPRVRALAAELVGKANQLYPQLEEQMRRTSIEAPRNLPADEQGRLRRIGALRGRAFDRAYLADQIDSHQTAIRVFQNGLANGQDAGIKALLTQALPVVQDSLEKLQALQSRIG